MNYSSGINFRRNCALNSRLTPSLSNIQLTIIFLTVIILRSDKTLNHNKTFSWQTWQVLSLSLNIFAPSFLNSFSDWLDQTSLAVTDDFVVVWNIWRIKSGIVKMMTWVRKRLWRLSWLRRWMRRWISWSWVMRRSVPQVPRGPRSLSLGRLSWPGGWKLWWNVVQRSHTHWSSPRQRHHRGWDPAEKEEESPAGDWRGRHHYGGNRDQDGESNEGSKETEDCWLPWCLTTSLGVLRHFWDEYRTDNPSEYSYSLQFH